MAAISTAKNTSASAYTVEITGLTVGEKYHLFIQDLKTDGSDNGWYCRYSQTADDTSFTYKGSTSATYSQYNRAVRLYCTDTTKTSHSVGTRYSGSQLPGDSDNVTGAWSAIIYAWSGGSTSYKVKVVLGTGISLVSYGVNTDSLTTGPVGSDFTENVGSKSGYVYIGISRIASGYTYPVTATDGTNTWTVANANGTYNDQRISAPSSGGTRTVTLTATQDARYYYQVHAYANGGKFSDGATDYYTDLAASTTTSINFDATTLKTPSRGGYTFKGWGYRSDATQSYTGTIPISATSHDSNDPTIYNLYAIWAKTEYTCYIKIGAGINSASVYVDGSLKSDIRDKVYHAIAVNYDSTIMVNSIAKEAGYARPYLFRFYQNSTATTPTTVLTRDTDTPSYDYSTSRFYAEIVATKQGIDLFYWKNSTWDAANIKAGQPVSNLTAAMWNALFAKTNEMLELEGWSVSGSSDVASGVTILSGHFNVMRSRINLLEHCGTLPGTQVAGNEIKASLFEGTESLKSALNAAITYHNNNS